MHPGKEISRRMTRRLGIKSTISCSQSNKTIGEIENSCSNLHPSGHVSQCLLDLNRNGSHLTAKKRAKKGISIPKYKMTVNDSIESDKIMQPSNEPLKLEFEAVMENLEGCIKLETKLEDENLAPVTLNAEDILESSTRPKDGASISDYTSKSLKDQIEYERTILPKYEPLKIEFEATMENLSVEPLKPEPKAEDENSILTLQHEKSPCTLAESRASRKRFQNVSGEQEEVPMKGIRLNCKSCGKHFKYKACYQKHVQAHENQRQSYRKFYCDNCGNKYSSKTVLENHMMTHLSLSCEICQAKFRREITYRNHMKMHSGKSSRILIKDVILRKGQEKIQKSKNLRKIKKIHSCAICGLVLQRPRDVRDHMTTHTGEKPFKCEICDKRYGRKSYWKAHIMSHSGQKLFKCNICAKTFTDNESLTIHMVSHSSGERPFKCEVCNKDFTMNERLVRHMLTHTSEKTHRCKECGKSYCQNSQLKDHQRVHWGVRCDHCGRVFLDKTHLINHNSQSHGAEKPREKPLECKICHKSYTKKRSFKLHVQSHEKLFQCKICYKRYSRQGDLKTHTRLHTGEKPFKCKICNMAFHNHRILTRHRRIKHGIEDLTLKRVHCDYCGKDFLAKSALECHLRKHTGEKPYECDFCGKRYSERGTVIEHIRIHMGIKPYSCKHCGKAFVNAANLRSHERTHTGDKPFTCKICGRSFTQNILKSHMMTHSSEKPFSCDICGEKFVRKDYVKGHIKSAHEKIRNPKRYHVCKVCGRKFEAKKLLERHIALHLMRANLPSCDDCGECFEGKNGLAVHMKKKHQRKGPST